MTRPLALALAIVALWACSYDQSAIAPGGPSDARIGGDATVCEPGTVDANEDPTDGCECTPTAPADELCDGFDNDCDRSTPDGSGDPGIGVPCDGMDEDLCEEGLWACVGGRAVCEDTTDNTREDCNGVDDDCDGVVDEAAGTRWYVDGDGDGYGSDADFVSSCEPIDGRESRGGDCDDADGSVNPGQAEACDLRDDDCDGAIDETCSCVSVVNGTRLYSFCSDTRTWFEARDRCVGRGQALAALESDAEDAFVVAEGRARSLGAMWIGLHDEGHEGDWRWVDETPIARSAWGPGEPNNGPGCCFNDENCGVVAWHADPDTWNDAMCSDEYTYVCESAAP